MKRKPLSLRSKLSLFGGILFILSIWLVVAIANRVLYAEMETVLAEEQYATAQRLALGLDQELRSRIALLSTVAREITPGALADPVRIQAALEKHPLLSLTFTGGNAVLNRQGVAIADYPVAPGRRGTDYGYRDYFRNAVATRRPVIDKPIMGVALKRPVLAISVPVLDASGEVLAVLTGITDLTAPSFLGTISDPGIAGRGQIYVISPRDRLIIASSDTRRAMQPAPEPGRDLLYDRYADGYAGSGISVSSEGIEKLYSGTRVPASGWLVLLGLPTEQAFMPAQAMSRRIALAAALLTACVGAALWLMSRRLLQPLQDAAGRLDAMTSGREPMGPLPRAGSREIRQLFNSFNLMNLALRNSERLYRSLFDNMLNGYAYCRMFYENGRPADFMYLSVNEAFTRLTGLEDVVGKRVSEVIPGIRERDPGLFEIYGRVAATGVPEKFEIQVEALQMWFSVSVYRPEKEHFVAVFDVITERKRAEAELDRHRRHLEELVAERTQALERSNRELESFSYSVSHDLRAPLRAINGFASVLKEEAAELSEENRGHLQRIVANTERMGRLIDDMLEYSRIGRAQMERIPVDLTRIAAEVADELSPGYPGSEVSIHELPMVSADPVMMRQVFANLIGNALKFSARADQPRVEVGAQAMQGGPEIYVRDNGAGFDMQFADRMFGVFQRLHKEADFPGTGVGLAIVKRLVERHGGSIRAQAAPGKGATFRFTLG